MKDFIDELQISYEGSENGFIDLDPQRYKPYIRPTCEYGCTCFDCWLRDDSTSNKAINVSVEILQGDDDE